MKLLNSFKLKGGILGNKNKYIEENLNYYRDLVRELASATSEIGDVKTSLNDKIKKLSLVVENLKEVVSWVVELSNSTKWSWDIIDSSLLSLSTSIDLWKGVINTNDSLVGDIGNLSDEMISHNNATQQVMDYVSGIDNISRQTTLLSFNAAIEAARAWENWRWFNIVATEVRSLANNTNKITTDIKKILDDLLSETKKLKDIINDISKDATWSQWAINQIIDSLNWWKEALVVSKKWLSIISQTVSLVNWLLNENMQQILLTYQELEQWDEWLNKAYTHLDEVLKICEKSMQLSYDYNIETQDTHLFELVKANAKNIWEIFSKAIKNWVIKQRDLFDTNFKLIPNTNPNQFDTNFSSFTDNVCPSIQEKVLKADPRIAFCVSIFNQDWYIPTHNNKFSNKQKNPDTQENIDWNNANCRNRRKFTDRVWLTSSKNTSKEVLVQIYIREMWWKKVPMIDASSPIFIDIWWEKIHWGWLRIWFIL